MPRITKVYTRTGDDGMTALGTNRRVSKNSARIEAYGTVDELNSQIGVAVASDLDPDLVRRLDSVRNDLFHLGSDLCVPEEDKEQLPVPRIEARHVRALEKAIDEIVENLPSLENFILPGGSPGAAALHVARCVCRRAERKLVSLAASEPIGAHSLRYLNRLSDALFVFARAENRAKGIEETYWNSKA